MYKETTDRRTFMQVLAGAALVHGDDDGDDDEGILDRLFGSDGEAVATSGEYAVMFGDGEDRQSTAPDQKMAFVQTNYCTPTTFYFNVVVRAPKLSKLMILKLRTLHESRTLSQQLIQLMTGQAPNQLLRYCLM